MNREEAIKSGWLCPVCRNNLCVLYDVYFASQHLASADKELYDSLSVMQAALVRVRRQEFLARHNANPVPHVGDRVALPGGGEYP